MRSKQTDDGRKIIAKVNVPLNIEDITAYSLKHLEDIGDNNPRNTLDKSNKRQIFNMAKLALYNWGTSEKSSIMKKHNGTFNTYRKIVENKFPECD